MKLITRLLSLLAVLCISLYLIYTNIDYDREKWQDFCKKSEYSKIYINFDREDKEIYSILTSAAKEHEIDIVKTDVLYRENSKILNSVFLGSKQLKLFDDKDFMSKEFFSQDQTEDDIYFSSKQDENSYGRIYSFLNWNNIEVGTLKRLLESGNSLKGEYALKYNSTSKYEDFLQSLARSFNTNRGNLTTIASRVSQERSEAGTNAHTFSVVCIIFVVIAAMFYSVKSLKNIGIMKLCGYSFKDIFMKIFGNILLLNFVFSIVFDFALIILFENVPLTFLSELFLNQCFVQLLIFLGMVPSLFLLGYYSINDLICDRNPSKLVNVLNFLIKSAVFSTLVFVSFAMPNAIKGFLESGEEVKKWDKFSNVAFLEYTGEVKGMAPAADMTNILNCKKMFTNLNDKGALYCLFEDVSFSPNEQLRRADSEKEDKIRTKRVNDVLGNEPLGIDGKFKTLQVNPNYFKKFEIKDESGKIIDFSNYENQRIVLRPRSSSFSEEIVKKAYDFRLARKLDSEEEKFGKYECNPKVKVLTYDDSVGEFCTFTEKKNSNGVGKLCNIFEKSLFFEVVPVELMTTWEFSDITFRGIHGALRMDLGDKKISSFNEEFKKQLEEDMGIKNEYKFRIMKSPEMDKINFIAASNARLFLRMVLALILLVFISFQVVKFYTETYKKTIAIKRVHGFNLSLRHKNYFMVLIVCDVFAIFLNCCEDFFYRVDIKSKGAHVTAIDNVNDAILISIIFTFVDILISYVIIKLNEKKKVPSVLKGD
ncbi:MAG: DUF1430 domain-containing protein [Oscillospiraceae bacterium]|jgi:hypothetical protein|nr:DUF1430 domain-containing protein [Oscillospiraceae bacterium]